MSGNWWDKYEEAGQDEANWWDKYQEAPPDEEQERPGILARVAKGLGLGGREYDENEMGGQMVTPDESRRNAAEYGKREKAAFEKDVAIPAIRAEALRMRGIDNPEDQAALANEEIPEDEMNAARKRLGDSIYRRDFATKVSDTATAIGSGVKQLASAPVQLVSPDGETARRMRAETEEANAALSPQMQGQLELFSQNIKDAAEEGRWAEVQAAFSGLSPALVAHFTANTLPSMIPVIGAGKAAQIAAIARGATPAGVALAGARGAGVANAVLNAGSVRGDAFQDLERVFIEQGMSPEEAKETALSESWLPTAVAAVTGYVGGRFGAESDIIGGAVAQAARGGVLPALKAAVGSLGREFGTEQLEELLPQMTTNLLAGRDALDGLAETAAQTVAGVAGPGTLGAVSAAQRAYDPLGSELQGLPGEVGRTQFSYADLARAQAQQAMDASAIMAKIGSAQSVDEAIAAASEAMAAPNTNLQETMNVAAQVAQGRAQEQGDLGAGGTGNNLDLRGLDGRGGADAGAPALGDRASGVVGNAGLADPSLINQQNDLDNLENDLFGVTDAAQAQPLAQEATQANGQETGSQQTTAPAGEVAISQLSDLALQQAGEYGLGGAMTEGSMPQKDWAILEQLGLIEERQSEDGTTYRAASMEPLFQERSRRHEQNMAKRKGITQEERDQAIEKRARNYERIAEEQDALGGLGDAGLAQQMRSKAAEIRSGKGVATVSAKQAAPAGFENLTISTRPTGTIEVSGPSARELVTQIVPGESVQQRKDGSVIVGRKYAGAVQQAYASVAMPSTMPVSIQQGEANVGQQQGLVQPGQSATSPGGRTGDVALARMATEVLTRTLGGGARLVTPGVETVRDPVRPGEYSSPLRGTAGVELGRLTGLISGRSLQFFEGVPETDGFARDDDDKFVFINADSAMSPIAVLSHEITHTMRRDAEDAYEGFVAATSGVVDRSTSALLKFAQLYDSDTFTAQAVADLKVQGKSDIAVINELLPKSKLLTSLDHLNEEFNSDLIGRASEHKDTWRMVAEEMARKDPSILRQFLRQIESLLNRLRGKPGFGHMDQFAKGGTKAEIEQSLEVIRKAAAQALARYASRSQEQRDALFAERNQGVVRQSAAGRDTPGSDVGHKRTKSGDYVGAPAGVLGDNEEGRYSMGRTNAEVVGAFVQNEPAVKYSLVRADRKVDLDSVPEFRFADHIGRPIFPTIADRTKAGGVYSGIDGAELAEADQLPMQGGPGFPLLSRNWEKQIVWATQGKAVVSAKANKIAKHGRPLMAVTLGDFEMHSSNATAVMSYMKTLEAYVRDGRISEENLATLTENIRGLKLSKEYIKDELKNFPGFDDADALHDFINGASFEARAGIVKEMGKPRSEKLGVPPADKLIRKLADPEYAGNRHLDTVLVLEPHDEETFIPLGEDGTDKHLSYAYGARGRVVGKLTTPVNARELWGDWFASKESEKLAQKQLYQDVYLGKLPFSAIRDSVDREYYRTKSLYEQEVKSREGQYEKLTKNEAKIKKLLAGDFDINLDRSFQMSMPIVEITEELASRMDSLISKGGPNASTAQAAIDMVKGNWKTSDVSVKEGGVGPADFAREIRLSEFSGTLTQYSEAELTEAKQGWKWGEEINQKTGKPRRVKVPVAKMRLFQLGDNRIQFALKYGPPDTYGQTIEGVSDNEVTLVAVVSNEPGVKGVAGPAIMTKAIEEGATLLDCYEVKTNRFTRGFLPTLYAEYGFEVVGRVPFDPEYLTDDHKYAWAQHGWEEGDAYPDIVLMKWKGNENDRAGTVQRYIEQGETSLRPAATRGIGTAASSDARQTAGSGAGSQQRQAADVGSDRRDQATGDRGTLASRAYETIKQVQQLDEDQLRNLGVQYSPSRSDVAGDERAGGSDAEAGSGVDLPEYGQAAPGAVSAVGRHYSAQQRSSLDGRYYGTGANGREAERVRASRDPRIKERIYFYVDAGKGITPEQNVGSHAHDIRLNNLYDANADTWLQARVDRGITDRNEWLNAFESAILDNGFDGYVSDFGTQRAAVLLGRHNVKPSYVGVNPTKMPGKAETQAAKPKAQTNADADKVASARALPLGQMTGADWKRIVPLVVPDVDVSMLDDAKTYYKDDVVSAMRAGQARMSPSSAAPARDVINQAVDDDFTGIVARMRKAGVLTVECS